MNNRSANVEYSRYMKMIGEQEAPISARSFNFYDVDVHLRELDDLKFKALQEAMITDMLLEDIIRKVLYSIWREEYISIKSWDLNVFEINESNLYPLAGIAETKTSLATAPIIKLAVSNLDVNTADNPKIVTEKYEPKIIVQETHVISYDSFSKYFESMDKSGL